MELTAGGGGNKSAARKKKIADKNEALNEERVSPPAGFFILSGSSFVDRESFHSWLTSLPIIN